jgi:hypothetical protein
MAKKIYKLPSISRAVANSTAILEVPVGATYHYIAFVCTGTGLLASMINAIRVLVNGQELQRFKNLQRLIDINNYHGRGLDTVNAFEIYFKEDDFNDIAFKRTPAWGTQDVTTFNIEIDLGAVPGDFTISATAYLDTVAQPLGVFTRIRETSINSAVAGIIETDKLAKGGAVYKQVHLFKSDVSSVKVTADSIVIIDASKTVLQGTQSRVRPFGRVPITASATHVDFMLEGDAGDLFDTSNVQDLRLEMNIGTSGVVEIVTEQIDQFFPQ